MHRIERTPVLSTKQRSATTLLVLAILVAPTLCGCGSRSEPPRRGRVGRSGTAEQSRSKAPERVSVVTRRARPAAAVEGVSQDGVMRLSPATARESRSRIRPSRPSEPREVLSLGSPRKPSAKKSRSSETKLSVLERYLQSPSKRREPSRRSERTESGSFDAETSGGIEWQPIFLGVDHVAVRASRPWPMYGQALRIDLREDGIEIVTTPGSDPLDTVGLKTSTFLRKFGCKAAINAAFFQPPMQSREGRPVDVQGLQVSRGELVSDDDRFPALLITRDNRATISGPPHDLDGVYNAVAGNSFVLRDGVVVGSRNDTHPRTGAGVSRDGRYLFLLVIDGRQEHWGWSRGAQRWHVGDWLKRLGAWDAINLDGGGTSTMAAADARGNPRLVNRPIHNNRPGNERVAGSHLGVIARPLAE